MEQQQQDFLWKYLSEEDEQMQEDQFLHQKLYKIDFYRQTEQQMVAVPVVQQEEAPIDWDALPVDCPLFAAEI